LEHAFARYPELTDYIRSHAQEMSEDVMRKHIDLYVNDYSLDLGNTGRKAVETLVATYTSMHPLPPLTTTDLFTV
ncbi:MAG: 1,4-dihydroxy-6-naphthoate synthase, partial [Bacteroidota bacterium]|nr:1,4-dihydroxy-6-naphthoate synthase [Bacteroidota bacterium]